MNYHLMYIPKIGVLADIHKKNVANSKFFFLVFLCRNRYFGNFSFMIIHFKQSHVPYKFQIIHRFQNTLQVGLIETMKSAKRNDLKFNQKLLWPCRNFYTFIQGNAGWMDVFGKWNSALFWKLRYQHKPHGSKIFSDLLRPKMVWFFKFNIPLKFLLLRHWST